MKIRDLMQIFLILGSVSLQAFLIFGSSEFFSYFTLRNELLESKSNLNQIESEVNGLKTELEFWINYKNFAAEKLAREELFLGKKEEFVYLFSKKT